MNKTSIAQVRKEFKCENEKLIVNQFANAIIYNKEIKTYKTEYFSSLDNTEQLLYMKLFKQSLAGKIGKHLLEYDMVSENFSDGGIGNRLNAMVKDCAENSDDIKTLIDDFVKNADYEFPYCVTLAHFTYNIPRKSQDAMDVYGLAGDDEDSCDSYSGNEFNFIILIATELKNANDELFYNEKEPSIERRRDENGHLVLATSPMDAFLYPTFNGTGADVNSIMYRTNTPEKPNKNIIENFLKCKFEMSGTEEEVKFNNVMYGTFGGEIGYSDIEKIQNEVRKLHIRHVQNNEKPEVSMKELSNMLTSIGFDKDVVEKFERNYDEKIGKEKKVKTVNITDMEFTNIKNSEIKINVKSSASDKVKVMTIQGKKCIVCELDENVEFNGLKVSV